MLHDSLADARKQNLVKGAVMVLQVKGAVMVLQSNLVTITALVPRSSVTITRCEFIMYKHIFIQT